ncbi:MAG: O-antigen ligase family protein [Chloroflexi bacterium]|nr:O-antigen ligase family protein [Chloroflexota bacterium]
MSIPLHTVSTVVEPKSKSPNSMDASSVMRIVIALFLGLAISIAVAVTAVNLGVVFIIVAVLAVPMAVLVIRYPFSAVMIWLIVFPFVVRGTSGFGVPLYNAVHRLLIPGALWLVLMQSWMGSSKRLNVRFGLAEFVMAISLLWSLGSIFILGQSGLGSLIDLYDRIFVPYCMYWLIRLIALTAEDLRRFLPAAFITWITQAAIGLASWFMPSLLPPQWLGEAGERVVGTFKNPAVYTTTVMFLGLLLFQYLINSKSNGRRLVAVIALALTLFCVLMSFSRGSWVGGSLALLGLLMVYPRVMTRLLMIGVVLIVILGNTVFTSEVEFANERLNDTGTVSSRLLTGAKSLGMIEARPLFGWGFGNYDLFDDAYRVITIDPDSVREGDHTSHNTFFTIMAEQGIPALVFYLFPALWWFLTTIALWQRMPATGFWSRTLIALLWLLILDHLTVSMFMDMLRFNTFGTTIYWMALGLIANVLTRTQQESESRSVSVPATQEYSLSKAN